MAQRARPEVATVTEGVRVALLGPVGVARDERLAQPTSAIVRTLLAALAVAGPPGDAASEGTPPGAPAPAGAGRGERLHRP